MIHIEESEQSESDHEPVAVKNDDSDFEIIESKSTEKPKTTEKPTAESSDEGPEVICISDALSSDTDINAEKLAKKAKKKEKKRAKKELKKMKKDRKRREREANANKGRKLSNVSDEWVERMKKRRESAGQIGPALPTLGWCLANF